MSVHDQVVLLRQIPLFAKVDESHLKVLAFATEHVVLLKGQTLIRQGDEAKAAFLIVDGEAEAFSGPESQPTSKTSVGRSAFVGEIAMLCGQPYSATIKAKSRLEALKITKELFFRVIEEFPEMAMEVMTVVNRRLDSTLLDLADVHRKLTGPGR